MIDILFTAPHNAVELAALIFCWAVVCVIFGWLITLVVSLGEIGWGILCMIGVVAMLYNDCELWGQTCTAPPKSSASRIQPSQRVTAKPAEPRPLTDAEVGITPTRRSDDLIREGDKVFGILPKPPVRPDY